MKLTSFISSLGMPALSIAALAATAPSSGAERLARLPLKEPMGVLTAETITTSFRETFVAYDAMALQNCGMKWKLDYVTELYNKPLIMRGRHISTSRFTLNLFGARLPAGSSETAENH